MGYSCRKANVVSAGARDGKQMGYPRAPVTIWNGVSAPVARGRPGSPSDPYYEWSLSQSTYGTGHRQTIGNVIYEIKIPETKACIMRITMCCYCRLQNAHLALIITDGSNCFESFARWKPIRKLKIVLSPVLLFYKKRYKLWKVSRPFDKLLVILVHLSRSMTFERGKTWGRNGEGEGAIPN